VFLPISFILSEPPLYNSKDCIKALETYLLPKYKDQMTQNIGYTKTECFGILMSFYQAGKLNPAIVPEEIDNVVMKFMDENLWVDPKVYKSTEVTFHYNPKNWLRYPARQFIIDLTNLYLRLLFSIYLTARFTFRLCLTALVRLSKLFMYRIGLKR
jgi:hypothetical protein